MIKKLIGLSGGGIGNAEVVNKRFTRYMQPVLNVSLDAGTLDSSQAWLKDVVETETEWIIIYNGANTQPVDYFGQIYANNDHQHLARKTKSNDVKSGWVKYLDVNGDPKPVFNPSFIDERFDEWQAWIQTVIVEGGTWKAWFIGDSGFAPTVNYPPPFSYRVGYATSTDEGETWTKFGTTPVYVDATTLGGYGTAVIRVTRNNDIGKYVMMYAGIDVPISGFHIAESTDGITGWTKTQTGILTNQNFGHVSDFRYIDGTYWVWFGKINMMPEGNLGPCRQVILKSTTDFITWQDHGVQLELKNVAQEFGIGNHVKVLQKPNGEWFMLHTYYTNRTQALAGITKEPALGIKVAESNNTGSFIMNSACDFSWPDYVTFHAPLDPESRFIDEIGQTNGVLSSGTASYWERGFIRLNGSQTLTFPNNGTVVNGGNFGLKMRIEIITSGNRNLFRIGSDINVTIESGKLRVRLSSDGLTYQKDYITTINIAKPAGLDYIDNHIYIAIYWNGTTLRMWNADCVEEFTEAQITKTVDDAMATINNSGSDVIIGENAAIELRSVSCLNSTDIQVKELDI